MKHPKCYPNLANFAIDSVYQGYQLNNNLNGYQASIDSLFSDAQGNTVLPNIQSPGVFTGIPMCSVDVAFYNWLFRNVSVMLLVAPYDMTKADIGRSIWGQRGMITHVGAPRRVRVFNAVSPSVRAAIATMAMECAYPTRTE